MTPDPRAPTGRYYIQSPPGWQGEPLKMRLPQGSAAASGAGLVGSAGLVVVVGQAHDPFLEVFQVQALVGGVGVLVRQPEAEQHAGLLELLVHGGDQGDGTALPNEHRFLSEASLERGLAGLDERMVEGRDPGVAFAVQGELHPHALGGDLLDVLLDELGDLGRNLVGHQAGGELGGGFRADDGLGAFAGVAAVDAVDLERGPRPDALDRGEAFFADELRCPGGLLEALVAEGQLLQLLALRLGEGPHVPVEAGDGDAAVLVVELRHHLVEDSAGVGDAAAEGARVQVDRGAGDFNLEVAQAPQAVADRGEALAQHGGVAHEQGVAAEPVPALADELVDVLAADFFFALDHELDVHRQAALVLHEGFQRLEVHEDLALVVHHAAGVELAVAQGQLPGRREPLVERLGRLHVVVAVEEQGGFAGGVQPLAVDDGMAGGGDELHFLQADALHLVGHPLRSALDVSLVFAARAHARNRAELFQLVEVTIVAALNGVNHLLHGNLLEVRFLSWGRALILAQASAVPTLPAGGSAGVGEAIDATMAGIVKVKQLERH